MVGEGDKVAVEATSEGKHISGQIYTNEYHFLFEFRDGKLLRLKEYMDTERVTDVLVRWSASAIRHCDSTSNRPAIPATYMQEKSPCSVAIY